MQRVPPQMAATLLEPTVVAPKEGEGEPAEPAAAAPAGDAAPPAPVGDAAAPAAESCVVVLENMVTLAELSNDQE